MPLENIEQLKLWLPPYRGEAPISDGILEPGTAMLIFGPPKSWKSITTIYTSYCIASGTDWFGYKTTACPVIVFQAELPKAVHKRRVCKFDYCTPIPNNILFETNRYCKLDTTYGRDILKSVILEAQARFPKQHIVLILDPVYLLMSGKISEEYDVRRMLDNLNELRDNYNLSIILIHHSHKTRVTSDGAVVDTGADEIFGSGYFNFWCDTQVRLKRLNPFTLDNQIGFSFTLTRNAEKILTPFDVEWSRATLQPTVIATRPVQSGTEEDVTSRGLAQQ